MKNMNKENFWDSLFERYPKSVKEFYDFIDQYKIDNNWNELFGDNVKFHHVPVEMQFGIWMAFQFDHIKWTAAFTFESDCFELENLWGWASEWFHHREIDINLDLTEISNKTTTLMKVSPEDKGYLELVKGMGFKKNLPPGT